MPERRKFLLGMLKSAGAAAVAGFAWAGLGSGTSHSFVLRPPGAISEEKFLAKCTKCGLCAEACPFDALIIARPGDDRPVGTPYFVMRENPCRMCRDIPCAAACPTGALDLSLLSGPDPAGLPGPDVNRAQIGIAVIDRETCIAYWGIQCDACYRACPVIDKAITVDPVRNDRTGKHAIMGPVVHSRHCTGCGMCERACVTKKASIFVLPRHIAMGEASDRYVRGWEEEDEQRLETVPEDTKTITPRSEKSPLDYLNRGDL
ncbi:MAG: ferredoxin-type protein NapG [Thermodesulfovibrionales bacterium]